MTHPTLSDAGAGLGDRTRVRDTLAPYRVGTARAGVRGGARHAMLASRVNYIAAAISSQMVGSSYRSQVRNTFAQSSSMSTAPRRGGGERGQRGSI